MANFWYIVHLELTRELQAGEATSPLSFQVGSDAYFEAFAVPPRLE